ncbi:hypothetical protein BC941DRAFT_505231 [Chlamydoabsidia padenii]|nr:hypothetical protein BC941DRAFT_505231 [Chlamydoabsidia padenii]
MYGAKGTTVLNTVARQSALSKQLATVHATNKTSAFISTFPARSGKLYTTSRTFNNTDKDNNKDQHLNNNPFAPLARASSTQWSSSTLQSRSLRQLRFQTSLAQKDQQVMDEPNARILELAKYKNYSGVLEEFKATSERSALTTQTYQAVMESYGIMQKKKTQPLTAMMGAFDEMVTQGVRPTSETYAIVIRSLCDREAEVNRASNVIRRQMDTNNMPTEGRSVQLHSVAHDALVQEESTLHALESEKNIQRAVAVFEQAVQENQTQAFDVELYNHLLRGLSYVGNTQDGLFIYEHLENAKVQPNSTTFAVLMSMFGTAGDLKAVRECFREYKSIHRALPRHDASFVYNALVLAHVNAGDLTGALRIVEDTMVKDRVPVTISPYNRIIYRAILENNMKLVSELVEKLKSDDHLPKPDANTYGLLLSGYSRANHLDLAQGAFEQLLTMSLHRQYSHITDYVSACLNNHQHARSMDVVRTMAAHGLELHVNLCCKVLSSHLDAGDIKNTILATKEILQLHAQSTLITSTSPLSILALDIARRADNLVDALDLLRDLNNFSIRSTPEVSQSLVKLYYQAKADPASWAVFKDYSTERSFYTLYEAAFKWPATKEQFGKLASDLLHDMHAFNIPANAGLYIRVTTRLYRKGSVEDEAQWKKTFEEYYPELQQEIQEVATQPTTLGTTTTAAAAPTSAIAEIRSGEALKAALLGDFNKALDVMKEKIIDQGMVPTPEAVRDMIQLSNKSNLLSTTSAIYDLVREPYEQHLDGKNRRDMMYLLNNSMLIAYARQMDLDNVKVYYNKLRQANMYPDGDAYGSLLACTANNATDESLDAMVIYEEAKKHKVRPTVYFYNVIISKLAKCRKMDQALGLFKEMKQLGVIPNSVTYASVISACIRCSAETRAVHYFEEMTRQPRYQPRIGVYNSMIQFYVQQRHDRDKALDYFQMLKQANLVPSAHTYKLLIEAYANIPAFDMVAAHNLLGEMKKRYGLSPTANHYATLMKSYGCFHRDVTSAEAVYNEMLKAGIKANELVYQAMMDTYIDNNKMPKAEALYETMLDNKVQSSPYIENLFIKGYGADGQVDQAEQVFYHRMNHELESKHDVVREPSSYEAMVKVYMNHQQVDKAKQVLDMMKQRDFPVKVVDGVALLIDSQ